MTVYMKYAVRAQEKALEIMALEKFKGELHRNSKYSKFCTPSQIVNTFPGTLFQKSYHKHPNTNCLRNLKMASKV